MKEQIKKEIISWLKMLIFCFLTALFINNVIIVNANVPSGSMENTIMTKDKIVAFRWSYIFSEPKRGDIIVFKFPDDIEQKILYVKRVIGIPGDKVEIKDGLVYLNNEIIEESYLKEDMLSNKSWGPYYVPEDSYFMLGDNRNYSADSRYWENTFVHKDGIVGKAFFKYFPKVKWLTE